MKGSFRSSDYLFRPTALAMGLASLKPGENLPLIREAKAECNGKPIHLSRAA